MTIERVISLMKASGHKVFTSDEKNYNLNIVGIRQNIEPDKYNDKLCVFWWYKGNLNVRWFEITTDPGLTGLLRPVHSKGTAILAPGQYRGSHVLGLHKGRYTALVQRGKTPVKVFRDRNRNDKIDMIDDSTVMTGWFGINIHKSNNSFTKAIDSLSVGPWSYGCQVFAYNEDFDEFISLCQRAATLWGNGFTYTLIEDLNK